MAVAPAADASFPGRNGRIAVAVEGCQYNLHIAAFTPQGRSLGSITPRCESQRDGRWWRRTFAPDWSPDGRRLLFADESAPSEELGSTGRLTFQTVAPDGTEPREVGVLPPAEGVEGGVSFAPDGRRYVSASGGALIVRSLDGSRRLLRRARELSFEDPRWSPDGRYLVAHAPGCHCPKEGLWLLDARTGHPLRQLVRGGYNADWAPDSRSVVFAGGFGRKRGPRHNRGGNLHTVGTAGGSKRRLLLDREGELDVAPVFSPDGSTVAFVALRFDGHRPRSAWLATVPAEGGRPRMIARLPTPTFDNGYTLPELAWQPL